MINQVIIGLAGLKQSGKTSAAQHLEKSGFVLYSFASTLKRMTRVFLDDFMLCNDEIEHYMNEGKERPIPVLNVSVRALTQTLGTEWGRNAVRDDLWTLVKRRIIEGEGHKYVVIDDIRFENEAQLVRDMGGLVIHIDRGGNDDQHASEQGIMVKEGDHFIDNDDTLESFLTDVGILAGMQIGIVYARSLEGQS